MKIITPRLTLRNWQQQDFKPFAILNHDPEVMKFFPKILNEEESNNAINKFIAHFEKHGFGLLAVERNDNKKFIGFIGLNIPNFTTNFTPCVEIGWRLAKEHWGQGLATEGATAILQHAFDQLKLKEIVAFTAKNNLASIAVMKKIGMKRVIDGDFPHPNLPSNHALAPHILYKINQPC